ncbi:MAG: hypothetical protein PCFJNLEI_03618 [Verrucomicrobiae bacterium]|nr:hypothetical protein [Verrucomicrobiae bacterium]
MNKRLLFTVAGLLLAAVLLVAGALSMSIHFSFVRMGGPESFAEREKRQNEEIAEVETKSRLFYHRVGWILFGGGVMLGAAAGLMFGACMRVRNAKPVDEPNSAPHRPLS